MAITTTRRVSIEVSPVLSFQVLVEDDESLDVVNQLGLDKLVAVRAPTLTPSSSSAATSIAAAAATTTKPAATTTVASQLGLSTDVTESVSEVNVYVIAESEKGQSAATFWLSRRECRYVVRSACPKRASWRK